MKKTLKTISMLKCLKLTIMEHCAMGYCHLRSTCVLLRLVQLHLAEHAPWRKCGNYKNSLS